MSNLDEQIYKIIDELIYVSCDYEQGEDVDLDAKANESYHAIKALIATQIQEARIDELQHIREFWGQAKDDTLSSKPFNFVALSDIDNRIAQLRSTQ